MSKIIKTASPKVVVYARVARDCDGALDAQVARLRHLASSHGWAEVTVIAEARPHRVSNDALRALCAADIVFIRDPSRLTRRLADQEVWAPLSGAGVEVIGADGASPLTGRDFGLLAIVALMNHLAEPHRAQRLEWTHQGTGSAGSRRKVQR